LQNAVINLNIFSGIYPLQRVKQKAWLIKAFTWKLQDLIYVVVNLPVRKFVLWLSCAKLKIGLIGMLDVKNLQDLLYI
jgi:hypothetical protein